MDSDVNLLMLLAHAELLKGKFPASFHHHVERELWRLVAEVYEGAGGQRRPFLFLVHTGDYGRIVGFNLHQERALLC